MRRRSRFSNILRLSIVAIVALGGGFLSVFLYQNLAKKNDSQALSATEFQPGRIIDDSIFYNPNTMTAAEIDAFIDSHSPACDMWGNGYSFGGVQNKEYARRMREAGNSRWHEPPYVCISEFYENPETHVTNFETNGVKQPGMLSAGEIIYKAAQTYNVNPQVLLVMLKKESYAWGDDWPLKWEYNTVMGYACPDGAPCNEEYFGFYNQMMTAAWQLNYYREHIYSYNYRPYATNNILYNPDRSCGSKPVYLENIATTSLYIYTPYVPNDDALRNYPGTSWCGSYGNRNFYMYFREWFGSTITNWRLVQEIEDKYDERILGKRKTEFSNCDLGRSGACVQNYENGSIVYSPETGAHAIYGDILSRYRTVGNVGGTLGYPTTDINCNIGRAGACVQGFENGSIVLSPELGAWEIYGNILASYRKNGNVDGLLGYPKSGINCSNKGCSQHFEMGVIYEVNNNSLLVYGDIFKRYARLNEHESILGYPISNQNCNIGRSGACVQEFENGVIIYSNENGAWEVYEPIRSNLRNNGNVNGKYGYPRGPIETSGSDVRQEYEGGLLLGQ